MRLIMRSLEAGKALGAEPEIARTYEELGLCLHAGASVRTAPGEDLDAKRCFELARATYRSLGLAADLARLESRNLV